MSTRGNVVKNNKTRFFYVLYSDKARAFDQSEHAYYPIYIIMKDTQYLFCSNLLSCRMIFLLDLKFVYHLLSARLRIMFPIFFYFFTPQLFVLRLGSHDVDSSHSSNA